MVNTAELEWIFEKYLHIVMQLYDEEFNSQINLAKILPIHTYVHLYLG